MLDREALEICPPGHPLRSRTSDLLAYHLHARYKSLGSMADLDEAIAHSQAVLQSCSPAHPDRGFFLNSVATYLTSRYGHLGRMEDLNKAIIHCHEALSLAPPGHPNRATYLITLSFALSYRYMQGRGMENLDEAIVLSREALELYPPGHPYRSVACGGLAIYISRRYNQTGLISDLDEAVVLSREAVQLCPPGHPDRNIVVENLALRLHARHRQTSTSEDLNEAIVLTREPLDLRPPGHPFRSDALGNHSVHLSSRFRKFGAREDLEDSISLDRDTLPLYPPGHPGRSTSLANSAKHLSEKHACLGGIEYLNKAIVLGREALALDPPGTPYRILSLSHLAYDLCTRYQQLGATEDLDEATLFDRDALECGPPGHPDRRKALVSIATRHSLRYEQVGEIAHLDQAIVLGQDILELSPASHPFRAMALHDLSAFLLRRHKHQGEIEDCNEAVVLNREALALRPLGHVERPLSLIGLADGLFSRYEKLGNIEDLDEAIVLGRDAVSLLPPDQQDLSSYIKPLGGFLFARFARSGQSNDREEMFGLYAQLADVPQGLSSLDLSATREWVRAAEHFQHSTTLLAYETSLRFLVQHFTILPSPRHQLNFLQKLTMPLAVDAFAAGLCHRSPTKAVELLEQGHSVFWSYLAFLRSPLDEVMTSGPAVLELTDRFKELTSQIRQHTVTRTLDAGDGDQRDRAFQRNLELQKVMQNIRELPGLSRFLSPSPFVDLQHVAREGPVIVVNASQYGCDALVILLDRDPVHIPLQITQGHVRDLSRELDTLLVLARSINVTRELASILRHLWDNVVSPIVDFLRTIHPCQSRIWWCPTAEFSFLPLHATGPYRSGEQNLSDLYISSYTSTLAALFRARQPSKSNPNSEKKRLLAVGQAKAVQVGIELDTIGQRVDGHATLTRIEGDEYSISRVSEELSKTQWVHLACNILLDEDQPLKTAFSLHDGSLTIQHLIQCELDDPEFAYLSASHTAIEDKRIPDEAMHLASGMMCAGFRSVVGTMGAVDDADAGKIASTFYDHILGEKGCLDGTRAAFALHETMKRLVDLPLDQRIMYVHLGV